jgi:hypothetical protein
MIEVDLSTKALWKMTEIAVVGVVGNVRDMFSSHAI